MKTFETWFDDYTRSNQHPLEGATACTPLTCEQFAEVRERMMKFGKEAYEAGQKQGK